MVNKKYASQIGFWEAYSLTTIRYREAINQLPSKES
jgi:hypothetical protein